MTLPSVLIVFKLSVKYNANVNDRKKNLAFGHQNIPGLSWRCLGEIPNVTLKGIFAAGCLRNGSLNNLLVAVHAQPIVSFRLIVLLEKRDISESISRHRLA